MHAWSAAVPPGHRYLQWKAVLASRNPLRTPLLRSVAVEAKVRRQPAPAWAGTLKTVAFHNERIRYTSMPFEYEDPLHPRMAALRRKYKLDAVVSGAASETEQFVQAPRLGLAAMEVRAARGELPGLGRRRDPAAEIRLLRAICRGAHANRHQPGPPGAVLLRRQPGRFLRRRARGHARSGPTSTASGSLWTAT